jgi:hypothetical protein
MTILNPFTLLMIAVTGAMLPGAPPDPPVQGQRRVVTTSMSIQRIVIRVPNTTALSASVSPASSRAPAPPPITWVEKRAGRCLPLGDIAAATITRTDSVDLVMSGGKRVRARLGSDCPALNFYSGVYLKPASDGKICADRDWVRSRSGGQCQIESFHALVPAQ